jgi:hypothetical protein
MEFEEKFRLGILMIIRERINRLRITVHGLKSPLINDAGGK